MNENETIPDDPTTRTSESSSGATGQIGPYRLLQKIGEGGMGEVYLAEQREPIRRRVALKVIKPGMDSKRVVARFEAERQALALMDHPNVAKVFDAGETPQGRPYFSMEYVKGVPITEHCDRQRLTTGERLQLFMLVCEGVQHAHQKGIIHRDIKPSNVLVQTDGERRIPKIIDFGVAKATEQKLTEQTLFTEHGQWIGTPEYMSPEQAELTAEDIDTRSDVYSLGVLLYQLLVGALPFDPRELRQAGFDEIRRKIREEEPSRPSARVSTLGDDSSDSANRRRTDPSSLAKQLRGDLDWIAMKALEKDRVRRYGSPNELSADIRRYLHDEPVLASPPSKSYRLGKFVRRHRLGVGFAAVLVVLVVGFTATFVTMMAVQARRIAAERDRANQEAETAKQALEFMTGLFKVSDPGEARGNSITAREVLDKGAERIDATLADQPEIHARLMATMGDVYLGLGLHAQAEPLLRQAVETRQALFGGDHPDTLNSMSDLALLYYRQGRFDEAEPLYLETLATSRRVLGDDHPDTLSPLNNLAILYKNLGRYDEAEPLYLEAVATSKRVLGEDHPSTLLTMNNLTALYDRQGRYDEAEPLYLETLEAQRRVLGDDHPDTLISMSNLALMYVSQGRYDEAEPLSLKVLDTRRRVLGDDHAGTLQSMNNLAVVYRSQGRNDEAGPLYSGALEVQRRVLGDDHPGTLVSMGNLGDLYVTLGRLGEAETLLAEAVAGVGRALPREHLITGVTIRKYGVCLMALGRYHEAEAKLLEAHQSLTAAVGAEHGQTLKVIPNLVELYEAWGKSDEAAGWRAKLPDPARSP